MRHTPRDTELNFDALSRLSEYWEVVREFYYPFEEGLKSPSADVYMHEMPGGQFTNLKQQAKSMGLESRWHEIADMYAAVNQLFGDIVKVTPSSKVVGDMAIFMVTNHLTPEDILRGDKKHTFPKSVVEMMQGMLGFPPELNTPLFAASRVAGWCAHVTEQHDHNRLIRPRSLYIGPKMRPYPGRSSGDGA